MELRTLMAASLLLRLLAATRVASQNNDTESATDLSSPPSTTLTAPTCSCPTAPSDPQTRNPTSAADPHILVLAVSWSARCDGDVQLTRHWNSSQQEFAVCHSKLDEPRVKAVLGDPCQQRRGCGGPARWQQGEPNTRGFQLDQEPPSLGTCTSLRVTCSVREEVAGAAGQLQAYKAATALLCCTLLVLAAIRFTRPTIQALQKRLSDRRQNRWVGPTQSHSVSYNRGKNTVKSSDPETRLSYPALERLTVAGSREPSSNRSSYNF